jgi:hypothetical protein
MPCNCFHQHQKKAPEPPDFTLRRSLTVTKNFILSSLAAAIVALSAPASAQLLSANVGNIGASVGGSSYYNTYPSYDYSYAPGYTYPASTYSYSNTYSYPTSSYYQQSYYPTSSYNYSYPTTSYQSYNYSAPAYGYSYPSYNTHYSNPGLSLNVGL